MPGRRQQSPGLSSRARWTAAATGLAVAGSAVAIALIPAGAASAKTARADYHAGSDKAVFTTTGVEDSNCLISTGGSTVYIKPGDRIDFSTGLAGLSLGGLNLQGGQLAGLDVTAKIDGGVLKGGRTLKVPAGKTIKVKSLSTGTHSLTWSAHSVTVTVPRTVKSVTTKVLGPLGGLITKVLHKVVPAHALTIPLSESQLKSGADLSWAGKIFVTKNAAKCTISVQTPTTRISAGPVHVTVPGQNVTVPGVSVPSTLPGVPNLTSPSSSSPKASTSTSSSAAPTYPNYQPPALTVPEMVVPQGGSGSVYNGGGYDLGLGTDNGKSSQLANGKTQSKSGTSSGTGGSSSSDSAAGSNGAPQTVDLASNDSGNSISGELPVLLAIIAVLTLAMVAGTYARLYLLGRKS